MGDYKYVYDTLVSNDIYTIIFYVLFAIIFILLIVLLSIIIKSKKEYPENYNDDLKSEDERLKEAQFRVNNPPGSIIARFGYQHPIESPNEEVEIDQSEIPWELQEVQNDEEYEEDDEDEEE